MDERSILEHLLAGLDLDAMTTRSVMRRVLGGEVDSHWIAGWLVALRAKGETHEELTGMAQAMREAATPVDSLGSSLVDTCGTGGDGANTFNVSTASAFVAAACGARVAKHGNRAVSSRCGSADVLEALGGRIDLGPDAVRRCIEELGFGFLFAPAHHAAMRHAGPARKSLGIRTAFNLLGPLTNPAGARHQVIGVFAADRVELVARVLSALGADLSLVVHGRDGLDEISVGAPTDAVLIRNGQLESMVIDAPDFGLGPHRNEDLLGGDAQHNAAILRSIFDGAPGAGRDIVVINAAAALWVGGQVEDLELGIALAQTALDDGRVTALVQRWVELTRQLAGPGEPS